MPRRRRPLSQPHPSDKLPQNCPAHVISSGAAVQGDARPWHQRIAVISAVLALMLGTLVCFLLEMRLLADERHRAQQAVTHMGGMINRQLAQALAVTETLAAFVRQGQGQVPDFDAIAQDLLAANQGISALELAPGGVIRAIVPLAGHEKAIGHDLLADPQRDKEARKAIESRTMTLSGPFTLLQGGEAMVGRLPVFLKDAAGRESFWGFTIALIRVPDFVRSVSLQHLEHLDYAFELACLQPDSGQFQVFSRSAQPLGPDKEQVILAVPNGQWFLSLAPVSGWYSEVRIAVEIALVLVLALVAGIVAYRLAAGRQALAESERKYRQLVTTTREGIWQINEENRIAYANGSMAQLLGYGSGENLLGLPVQQFFFPDDAADVQWEMARVREDRCALHERRLKRKDGQEVWCLLSCSPLHDSRGRYVGSMALVTDYSERKIYERQLLRESAKNRTLLHVGSDGIHVLDEQGYVQEVSDSFCDMLGYSRDELIGMHITQWDALLSPIQVQEAITRQFQACGRSIFETRHRRKDGTLMDVEIAGYPFELDGKPMLFNSARDVTQRNHAQAEQRRLNRMLHLLNDSNLALLHADQEENLLPEICRLIVERGGYRAAWVGFPDREPERHVRAVAHFGHEDSCLKHLAISRQHAESGCHRAAAAIRTGKTQIGLATPEGAPWEEQGMRLGCRSAIALPLITNGVCLGVLSIRALESADFAADEIKLLESLANNLAFGIDHLRAKLQLATANKELQGFIYAASHDLKAPLGRINSFSTLLERNCRERLEGDGLMFLDFIRRNAIRVNTLIDDLLAHAQVENKILHLECVDIETVVHAILMERDDDIREAKAEIRLDLQRIPVRANPHGLAMVLRNLLENALKYSARANSPMVEIGARMEGERCRLWVRDNGVGFDMVYHDQIFEIFRRLHTYEEFPGSGIGLALVRKAMDRMGGRVWAQSAPGQGATFCLELKTESCYPEDPASAVGGEQRIDRHLEAAA